MKGLIIKNFYSLRKVFKGWIFTGAGIFAFLLLLKLASLYGNLKDSFEVSDISAFMMIFAVGLSVVGSIAIEPMISSEIETGMHRTVRSMPISYKTNVLSHYATLGLLTVLGFIIAMIFLLICDVAGVSEITGEAVGIIALVELLVVAFVAIKICLMNIFRNKALSNWFFMGIIFIVTMSVCGYMKSRGFENGIDAEIILNLMNHKALASVIIVSVSTIIVTISCLLSVKIRRGDE